MTNASRTTYPPVTASVLLALRAYNAADKQALARAVGANWTGSVTHALSRFMRDGLVRDAGDGMYEVTPAGRAEPAERADGSAATEPEGSAHE